jgi:uncharacterized cupin superfamily protein
VPNIHDSPAGRSQDGLRVARLAQAAGAEQLGMSLYELEPGDAMHFHYHLGREELLVALSEGVVLRTAGGRRELAAGEVVAFPRGERGAHGFENGGDGIARVLMISEQTAPNVSVYPDERRVGVFDAARREERRFGALFDLGDAVSGYGGGQPGSNLT